MKLRSSPAAMVIVEGTDIHHDLIGAALALQEIVVEAGIPASRAVGMDRFTDPTPATAEADVFVIYRSSITFDRRQQQALSDLVTDGKGLVVLHASNLFGFGDGGLDADRAAFELVGSRYISHGDSGSEGRIDVKLRGTHPVTRHMSDFAIDDEFYVLEYAADVRVLAERSTSTGMEPIAYVRDHGAGRVCYIALGHDARAWGNPYFRQLVRQATLWAAGVSEVEIASWSTRWPLGNGRTIGGEA
jgi:type 1 glutamine amidotransferase